MYKMASLTKSILSNYRKKILTLLKELEHPLTRSLYLDDLIKGVPGEVMRKCGKKNCACSNDPQKRHGPYKVISVYKNGRQKQISIKKSDEYLWDQAVNYQYQINSLKKARELFNELESISIEIIQKRLKEFPNE